MSEKPVIPTANLDNILGRLVCFGALLDAIRLAEDDGNKMVDALYSAGDLLACICRDFQEEIDRAGIPTEETRKGAAV